MPFLRCTTKNPIPEIIKKENRQSMDWRYSYAAKAAMPQKIRRLTNVRTEQTPEATV